MRRSRGLEVPGVLSTPPLGPLFVHPPAQQLLHVGPVVQPAELHQLAHRPLTVPARTPGWGSGVAAPGSTARRACPTCLQNSSSFWPLGDRDPALSWSHLVSPGHWASRWRWGLGAHRRDTNRSPFRTPPCSHLKGGLQYCLESHFLLPVAARRNLLGSSK